MKEKEKQQLRSNPYTFQFQHKFIEFRLWRFLTIFIKCIKQVAKHSTAIASFSMRFYTTHMKTNKQMHANKKKLTYNSKSSHRHTQKCLNIWQMNISIFGMLFFSHSPSSSFSRLSFFLSVFFSFWRLNARIPSLKIILGQFKCLIAWIACVTGRFDENQILFWQIPIKSLIKENEMWINFLFAALNVRFLLLFWWIDRVRSSKYRRNRKELMNFVQIALSPVICRRVSPTALICKSSISLSSVQVRQALRSKEENANKTRTKHKNVRKKTNVLTARWQCLVLMLSCWFLFFFFVVLPFKRSKIENIVCAPANLLLVLVVLKQEKSAQRSSFSVWLCLWVFGWKCSYCSARSL